MKIFSYAKEERIKKTLKGFEKAYDHVHQSPYGTVTLSEGCRYLKDEFNAENIFNLIVKYQALPEMKHFRIQHWTFEQAKTKTTWILSANSGNRQTLHHEFLSYLSFPVRRIELYFIRGHLCLLNEL
jgi:hypothetical protein